MEGGWAPNMGGHQHMELPPGFRFHPTDEELVTHYLSKKAMDARFHAWAIAETDLNKREPWDLPLEARMGEKEWYFFCVRGRKYPTGHRTNRATDAGYWKATGKDKEIYEGKALVGMKKTLVFYVGRAPKGEKTNWVMHEYRLEGNSPSTYNLPKTPKSEWVICRVFEKSPGGKQVSGLFVPLFMESGTVARGRAPDVTCFSRNGMEGDGGHHPLFPCYEPDNIVPQAQLLEREMVRASQVTGIAATDQVNTAEISSVFPNPCFAGGTLMMLMDNCFWNC